MKKITAIVLALLMVLSVAACSNNKQSETEDKFTFALVIGVGGLGDGSFNDLLKEGCDNAVKTYGLDPNYQLIEPKEVAEFEGHFTDLAASKKYDLIVCGGFDAIEAVTKVAGQFPEQKFLFVDGEVDGCDNVTSVTYRDNEKAYCLGIVAANETDKDKIGIVLALDIPSLRVFSTGFIAGARSVKPDIEVEVKIVGGFADTTTAKELAIALKQDGIDTIYVAAGGSGLGCFAAAEEQGGLKLVGVDINQCLLSPTVIISGLRLMQVTIENGIGSAIKGTLKGGPRSEGFAEDALGWTTEGSTYQFKAESLEMAEKAKADIVSGAVKVPTTYEEINFQQ